MRRKELVLVMLMQFVAVSQMTRCGLHEIPTPPCGNPCPPTCAMPKPRLCPEAICIKDSCVCEEGYIRSENMHSPCILKSKCPKPCINEPRKCGPHEVFTKCNYTTCVAACNRMGRIFCPIEGVNCTSGCLCAEGFVRLDYNNLDGPCVPVSNCPCNTRKNTVEPVV